jgi:hypothetical protein
MAVVIGFISPRFAFFLLLASGGYLDLVKRFMVLDAGFGDVDLAYLLGFAPAIVAGIMAKFFLSIFTARDSVSTYEIRLFVVITLLCLFLGGTSMAMGDGLRSAGAALNMVVYLYMPLVILRLFRSTKELKAVLIMLVIVYLPAALWAVNQAKNGLADFEMAYLLSGMTNEVRQLDEAVFRNMGTMVSAHALSMVSSILIAALIIPVSWKSGKLSLTVLLNPIRWVCIVLLALGAYYTFSRTGWVCAIVAILAFLCLQSRILTYTGFFAGIAALVALYLSAEFLLETRVMQHGQDWLFNKYGTSAEARQTLVIGTLDARLESMSNFVNEESLWSPFGLKLAGREMEVKLVHDILSETIVKIGYIPLSILVLGTLACVFISFRALFRMPLGTHRTLAAYFMALTIGMLAAGFSQGAMILYFPINLIWCLFFAMAHSAYRWGKLESRQTMVLPGQASTYSSEGILSTHGSPRLN